MEENKGFLDDTSLSKTPKSPLKTSTVLRPTSKRSENLFAKRLAACGIDGSFNPGGDASFQALTEVTNIPQFSLLKQRFKSISEMGDDANSSLGILHNISDTTDLSLPPSSFLQGGDLRNVEEPKQSENSNFDSISVEENPSISVQNVEEQSEGSDRNSSPDIVYDGTNIPELNLDYNPFSVFHVPTNNNFTTAWTSKHLPSVSMIVKDNEESFFKDFEAIKNNSDTYNSIRRSLQSSNAEASNEESKMTRDSLFETFNPEYDSIFKSLMPNASVSDDDKVSKLSQVMNTCSFVDGNSSELQAILQNQSLAEKNFLKNLQRLNETSSLKFSPDEMSARSTSFGTPSPSNDYSQDSLLSNKALTENTSSLKAVLDDEGSKEVVLSGSVFVNNPKKHPITVMEQVNETPSFDPDSLECSRKTNADIMLEKDSTLQSMTCDEPFVCDLNFKDISQFISSSEIEQNQFEIPGSDFITKDEALELFKKEEEKMKEEHKFEIADKLQESVNSVFSLTSENNVTAPSWFLELNDERLKNSGHQVSIGTLISARTENLGRLSVDSKRERPFFGVDISTPVRENTEDSSALPEFTESTLDLTNEQGFENNSETPTGFKNIAKGNEKSALRSVPNHKSEILRSSVLSQLLSEASTSQPLELADRIFNTVQTKSALTNCNKNYFVQNKTKLCEESLSSMCGVDDKTLKGIGNELDKLTASTSKGQDPLLSNLTNISSVNSSSTFKGDEKDSKGCECANCLLRQQNPFCSSIRPASSCSSSCKNAMPFHNTLQGSNGSKTYSNSQEQCHSNLHSSYGSMQHLGNCVFGGQFYNPYAPNTLPTQMLSVAIPQSGTQGPLTGFSSTFPMQGAVPFSCLAVQGPNELCVPQKICVGDSQSITLTLQNIHSMQYFYHLSYVSACINDKPIPNEMAGIHFPMMFPRNMASTTDIQITLLPKYEGNIVVVLQIVMCINPSEITMAAIGNSSFKTKIQYEAVRPSISITSHGKDNLNVESIIAGSKVLEHISITNNCDAVVPICLNLSSDSKDNRISFRINEMKLQNCATQCKVLSPKTIFCRLSNSNNKEAASSVQIPVIFEAGSDNCDLNFTLIATLPTASFSEPLGFFRISATVGRAELVLTDTTQKRLLLCSETGSVCNQNVAIQNKCIFPVVYDLMVVNDDSNSFSVAPTTLNLQPSETIVLKISFSPTSTLVVKGNLQAAAQPHGKVFDLIELIGSSKSAGSVPSISRNALSNVASKVPTKDIKRIPYNTSDIIESDKKYLSWGGVDIGSTVIKTVNIRNCTNKHLQTKFFIKEKSQSSFKIIDTNDVHTSSFILEFAAKEQKCISVAFAPTQIAPSSAFLGIKPLMESVQRIFSIPLAGYGGPGKLRIAEVYEKEGIGHCLDIIVSREQRTFYNNLKVQNIGLRPIFVKVVVSSGNSGKENVVINPSEFILFENDSKTLIASCSIENFSLLNTTDFGFITLLYGDEIVRQQLRRSLGENSTKPCTLYRGINFDVPFIGEERVPYDSTYVSKINISSLFSSSIKKQLVYLNIIEKDENCSQMAFDALSVLDNTFSTTMENSTMLRRVTAGAGSTYSPPVKDFTIDILNRLSLPDSPNFYPKSCSLFKSKMVEDLVEKKNSSGFWTVKPEILTIDSTNKDNRILLINLSKHDMKFKVESPIDVISVSPLSGIISAGGQIGLRICVITYSINKLGDDYKGYIKVICDGTEKSVLIKVLKNQKRNKDSINISESNTILEQSQEMPLEASIVNKTIINSNSILIKSLCEFPREIILNATAPGKISETTLVVHNPEKSSVEWSIHPFSMLFTQSLEDSLNVSSVLQILPSSGCLQSKEKTNIVIKFMPSNPDCFYRFFELSLSFSNGVKQKFNFKISASSFLLAENPELNKSSVVARVSKRKSRTDIYIEDENIEFPVTSVGENSTAFVIAKNPSMRDYKLNITKPHMPFMVHQSSVLVRSKKFLKIPVIFKPTKRNEMDYEDILLLQSENGHEFMIKLKGICN